ncbi:MAG: SDR family oxidoreductase, partial [Pseudomonadota bacterium]
LAPKHINVNAIAPGYFPSKMTAHLAEFEEDIGNSFPIHRVGSPQDAAGTAIYLSSRASAWVTGNIINLDGGAIAAA